MAPKKQTGLDNVLESEGIPIAPPITHLSLLSNIDNMDFAIRKLQEYAGPDHPVIGFDVVRSAGVRERNYRVFSKARAAYIKEHDASFAYISREELISRKTEIKKGVYVLQNGTIVGYTHS